MKRIILFSLALAAMVSVSTRSFAQSAVTDMSITLTATPDSYNGPCPGTITFKGVITVKGRISKQDPVQIGYQFLRSDGGTGTIFYYTITEPGTKEVSTTWTLGGSSLPSFTGWVQVKAWPTGHEGGYGYAFSNKADFKLNCSNQPSTRPNSNVDIMNMKQGIIIGGDVGGNGGQFVPWGGTVKLSCKNALPGGGANGQYAFNVTYSYSNTGTGATGTFVNKLYSDANVRAINSGLSLNASETKSATTQPYLDCGGTHKLILRLDDGNAVSETNEANNEYVIYYYLSCDECK